MRCSQVQYAPKWGKLSMVKQASTSFLKKRSKKLLLNWTGVFDGHWPRFREVFCFFFSKKKFFLAS